MRMKWRLILQKELSSAYAMALDDALHRVAGKESVGTLHLYSIVPALLLGRWQRIPPDTHREVDTNRRLTGGGSVLCDESYLLFSLAVPSSWVSDGYERLKNLCKVMGKVLKGRMGADGLIRSYKKVVGFLSVGTDCPDSLLFQGGLDLKAVGARSLAIAQRILKERLEEHFNTHFAIDTLTTEERDWLQHLLKRRYLLDEWRSYSEPFSESPIVVRRLHARLYVKAVVSRGVIESVSVWGDFIGDAERLQNELKGKKATKRNLLSTLKNIPSDKIPYGFKHESLLTAIHNALRRR